MPGSWAGLTYGVARMDGRGGPRSQPVPESRLDARPVSRRGCPKEGTSVSEVEVSQAAWLHHYPVGCSVKCHLKKEGSLPACPVNEVASYRSQVVTGGMGGTVPEETSDVANVVACAGWTAGEEAGGQFGWEETEGGRNGRQIQPRQKWP